MKLFQKILVGIIILFSIRPAAVLGQLFSPSVRPTPKKYTYYPINADAKRNSAAPWIVYSDRKNNFAYTRPGGTLVNKGLEYMSPYLVRKIDGDFLFLIKANIATLKKRKIKDKKSIEEMGWVNRSNLLLWKESYLEENSGFTLKSISILNGADPINYPENFLKDRDSVLLYTTPTLDSLSSKKIALNQYVYIYKYNNDKSKVLVGNASVLDQKNPGATIYGWVPSSLIKEWGSRLYVWPKIEGAGYSAAGQSKIAGYLSPAYETLGTGLYHSDIPVNPSNLNLLAAPIYGNSISIPAELFDKSNVSVTSLKGTPITYGDFIDLNTNLRKVNIVFLVDGGSSMANYSGTVLSSIKGLKNSIEKSFPDNQLKYGAVVYRNRSSCDANARGEEIAKQALSDQYSTIAGFLDTQSKETINNCPPQAVEQPYNNGLAEALNLLTDNWKETNIIIAFGTTANATDRDLSEEVAKRNTRIYAAQVYNDNNPIFDNYYLQSKALVQQSARKLTEALKGKMVASNGLGDLPIFTNSFLQDSMTFMLDYPQNSFVQGGASFPDKGSVMPNTVVYAALGKFLSQVNSGALSLINNIDSAISLVGIDKKHLKPYALQDAEKNGANIKDVLSLPSSKFRYGIKTTIDKKVLSVDSLALNDYEVGLILDENEYKTVIDILGNLAGGALNKTSNSFKNGIYKTYMNQYRFWAVKKVKKTTIKNKKLSEYYFDVLGMPFNNNILQSTTVESIKNLDVSSFESLVKLTEHYKAKFEEATIKNHFFISNGKKYYYISNSDLN